MRMDRTFKLIVNYSARVVSRPNLNNKKHLPESVMTNSSNSRASSYLAGPDYE